MINSSMLPTQESGKVVFKANGGLVRYIGSLSQISMDGGRLIVREPSSVSNLNLINAIVDVDGWKKRRNESGDVIRNEFWLRGGNSNFDVIYQNEIGETVKCDSFTYPQLSRCAVWPDDSIEISGSEVFYFGLKF